MQNIVNKIYIVSKTYGVSIKLQSREFLACQRKGHERFGLTIVGAGALAGSDLLTRGDKRIRKMPQINCDKSKYP